MTRAHLKKFLVVLLSLFASRCSDLAAEDSKLDQQIREIRSNNSSDPQVLAQNEKRVLDLLAEQRTPEEKGELYAALASLHSEQGYDSAPAVMKKQASKTIGYCKNALQYPLDEVSACRLCCNWTSAAQILCMDLQGDALVAARREALKPCLEGLKMVLRHLTVKEDQALPQVEAFMVDAPPNSPVLAALLERNQAQWEERHKVQAQNELLRLRGVFISQCTVICADEPEAMDEFLRLAIEKLQDTLVVQEIGGKIQERIAVLQKVKQRRANPSP